MKTPGLAPLTAYEEHIKYIPVENFVRVKGQRVFAESIGNGPRLVFVHGFTVSSFAYREMVPRLKDHFRLTLIDLNGFGKTERPADPAEYHIVHQADLVAQVIEQTGGGPVTLVGHSYGGALSMIAATRHPALIKKLFLIAPATEFGDLPWYVRPQIGRRIFYWLMRWLLSDPKRFRRMAARSFFRPELLTEEVSDYYRREMLVEGFATMVPGYLISLRGNGARKLPTNEIGQACFLVVGEQDSIVSPESCQRLADNLPHCNLIKIANCGHSIPEERPDELAELLRKFCQEAP
jgi:pimeloyl-ACP methyl ester carboxylesterase